VALGARWDLHHPRHRADHHLDHGGLPPGENINASLSTTAEQWGIQRGEKVTKNDEATFRGLPARRVTITGLEQGKDDATIEALMARRRDQLIVVVSRSVYADHPHFARLVGNFNFL